MTGKTWPSGTISYHLHDFVQILTVNTFWSLLSVQATQSFHSAPPDAHLLDRPYVIQCVGLEW